MNAPDYEYLRKLLKERSGLDLSADKQYLIESRLLPLARKAGLSGIPELVQKLHVTPEPNPTSEKLQKGGDENIAKLKTLSVAAFDKAYIDHEVAYHEAVLSALDKTLIPSAQNAELKALLVKVRPAFVAHLDMAKQIQSQLGKSGA